MEMQLEDLIDTLKDVFVMSCELAIENYNEKQGDIENVLKIAIKKEAYKLNGKVEFDCNFNNKQIENIKKIIGKIEAHFLRQVENIFMEGKNGLL